MDIALHHRRDTDELTQRIRHEPSAKQRDRYRAVRWALQGRPASWIAAKLERSHRFVQKWAYAYRDGGLDAIAEQPRTGAPTKLPQDQEQAFKRRLDAGPLAGVDRGVCTLRGKDVVRILEQEFGVRYSLDGAYDLLHRLGYACLKPRPRHRKNDPQVMAAWRHDTPL